MVYTLYPLGSIPQDPAALWLPYDWNDSFDNREWRPCVEHFLNEVAKLGHEVVPLPSPAFRPGEDFTEIVYLVAGVRTTFMPDQLLSLITIHSEDPRILRAVWETIATNLALQQQMRGTK